MRKNQNTKVEIIYECPPVSKALNPYGFNALSRLFMDMSKKILIVHNDVLSYIDFLDSANNYKLLNLV